MSITSTVGVGLGISIHSLLIVLFIPVPILLPVSVDSPGPSLWERNLQQRRKRFPGEHIIIMVHIALKT